VAMRDYEIRDVMGRNKYPVIEINVVFVRSAHFPTDFLNLQVSYHNIGRIYAQYVNGFVQVPRDLFHHSLPRNMRLVTIEGVECCEFFFENIHKDIIDVQLNAPGTTSGFRYITRYDPVLPGLRGIQNFQYLITEETIKKHPDSLIRWAVYADNSPRREGQIRVAKIEFRD
jgi:hypothetical protein